MNVVCLLNIATVLFDVVARDTVNRLCSSFCTCFGVTVDPRNKNYQGRNHYTQKQTVLMLLSLNEPTCLFVENDR